MVGSSRQKWIDSILALMKTEARGFGVDELRQKLLSRLRNAPSARQITSNLKIDKRFQTLGKTMTGSLMRNRSHEVYVFGITGLQYEGDHPFRQK
jgi:hypothetical protein